MCSVAQLACCTECNPIVQCLFCFDLIFVILLGFRIGKSRSKCSAPNYDLTVHVLETGKLLNFVEISVNNVTRLELQLTLRIRTNIAIGPCYNKYPKFAQAGCDFLFLLFRVTGCSLPPPSVL
jgi:hypothetical protein